MADSSDLDAMAEQLTAASTEGDLSQVQTLLSQRQAESSTLPGNVHSQALTAAIENNHTTIVSYLLSQSFPIYSASLDAAVRIALRTESPDIFQAFLDHGWDINKQRDHAHPGPLGYVHPSNFLVRWFLAHNASPDAACTYGFTPFTNAASGASLPTIQLLVAHGATIRPSNVLHAAAKSRHTDRIPVMAYFLAEGADIDALENAHDPRNFRAFSGKGMGTALHVAAMRGNEMVTEFLLANGAKTDIRDSNGKLAVEVAEKWNQQSIVSMLQKNIRFEQE